MTRLTTILLLAAAANGVTAPLSLREQALDSLRRGVDFFRTEVAVEGTYLWQYSEDLTKREGEGKSTARRGWVQPPGTPAVGMALLAAYRATRETNHLESARETAYGLCRGQLHSGGWTYSIEFDPGERARHAYRDGGGKNKRNVTTFDDDTTQAALRFLMQLDQELQFRDRRVHEAVEYALNAVLRAQYPNGAWPQGYDQFPDPGKFAVLKASYPPAWERTWPGSQQYWLRYTLNDNLLADLIQTLLDAHRVYRSAPATNMVAIAVQCRRAAEKAGDFLLLAQMPEPQPAWTQQYDFGMQPAWARKFEPPSVSGGESQGALRILLDLYRETRHRKYLEPIPRALEYLRRSRLPDGRLARFYELRSNKPLYFTRDYRLTTDDGDLPTHYAFKVPDRTAEIAREYERQRVSSKPHEREGEALPALTHQPASEAEVKAVIAAQDARGRWVEEGRLRYHGADDSTRRVIRSATFIRNIETLSRYLRERQDGLRTAPE